MNAPTSGFGDARSGGVPTQAGVEPRPAKEPQWTPGPWEPVCHGEDSGWWSVLRGAWDVSHNRASEPGVVADARYSAMTPEENEANAALIAAAPDLYDLLVECREAMARYDFDMLDDAIGDMPQSERDLRNRVDAVLAKARGEAP